MRTQSPQFDARDFTRRPYAKRCAMSRRADRVAKSAILFLAFAFPADGQLTKGY